MHIAEQPSTASSAHHSMSIPCRILCSHFNLTFEPLACAFSDSNLVTGFNSEKTFMSKTRLFTGF